MDPRFRPQKFTATNLEDVKLNLLPAFAKLNAYPDPHEVREMEDKYWEARPLPDKSLSGESVPKNTDPGKMAMHNEMHGTNGSSSGNGGSGSGNRDGASNSQGSVMATQSNGQTDMIASHGTPSNMGGHHGGASMHSGMS
jgi:hypothetical protein